MKRARGKGDKSPRRLLSLLYRNTPDKCQPPRIKPHSPQLRCHRGVSLLEAEVGCKRTGLPPSSKTNKEGPDLQIGMGEGSFQVINFLIAFVKHVPCWKPGHGTLF